MCLYLGWYKDLKSRSAEAQNRNISILMLCASQLWGLCFSHLCKHLLQQSACCHCITELGWWSNAIQPNLLLQAFQVHSGCSWASQTIFEYLQ